MKVGNLVREAFAKRVERRIDRHTNSMFLASSVKAKDVELFYAIRINRLRSLLFSLQQGVS